MVVNYKDVAVSFGKFNVLHDINFELSQGDFLHIIRQNDNDKKTFVTFLIE